LVGGLTGGWAAARAASRWVRISGMTCSVLPIRDSQPHSQLAWRWPLWVGAAGLTVILCPATCSLTEMVTGHLRSVGYGRSYPLGKPVTNLPAGVRACGWSRLAVVTPRYAPVPIAALAGVPRPGHGGPEGRCEAEGQPSATEQPRAAETYSLVLNSLLSDRGIPGLGSPTRLHMAHGTDQGTVASSQFSRRGRFVETPAFLSGPSLTWGGTS
jgi:hypothetical protein